MNKKGFTLIEMLVVIAIIGMLSSIIFASLSSSRQKARISVVQTNLRSFNSAAILCDDGQGKILPPADNQSGGGNMCTDVSVSNAVWAALPSIGDWVYTVTDVTGGDGVWSISATGDGKTVTCTQPGCKTE